MLRIAVTILLAAHVAAQENPLVGRPFVPFEPSAPLTWVGERPPGIGARGLTLYRWWTTGCGHCRASLPALSDLVKRQKSRVTLVAVFHPKTGPAAGMSNKALRGFLDDLGVDAVLARDSKWAVLKQLMKRGNLKRFTSVSFLVDEFGKVLWVHQGPRVHPTPAGLHGTAGKDFKELDALLKKHAAADARHLRVMSFNIRYGTARDGDNAWPRRRELVLATIRRFDPDILGTQETLPRQRAWLSERLPGYHAIGRGRQSKGGGEQCTIFIRKSRVEALEFRTFWLSPTPEIEGSRGWDAALPRIATWLRFKDLRSRRTLRFVNTHFDHRGKKARTESGLLLHQRIAAFPEDEPVIVTGDFNAKEGSAPYKALLPNTSRLIDTFRATHPWIGRDGTFQRRDGTFHGFRGIADGRRIDWVLVTKHLAIRGARVDNHSVKGRWPSDHFPVTAVLSLR
ncbi:MAG: endonuclease/exonuclease/phosphatase family protein [Planctomycetes bacterium]|nr:endonuclease/exonuclease/phosphatase family protein [Planctomycetota bacterium]